MDIRAHLSYLRMSPRKVRLVADMIRGMDVSVAEQQLLVVSRHAATPVLKLLKSAIANAENNARQEKANLFVKSIVVNQGPTMKRFRPRAFGRAAPIRHRSSHVTIILGERRITQKSERKDSHPVEAVTEQPTVKTEAHSTHVQSTSQEKKKSSPLSRAKSLGDKIIHRRGDT